MNYSIIPDHDLKIIRYRHSGLILDQDIHAAWMQFLSMKEFTELGYNLLSDYRNSKFDIPIGNINSIIEFMMSIKHVIEGKKQSLIVNNPYNTAASLLFSEKVIDQTGFDVKVFFSEDAALEWLIKK